MTKEEFEDCTNRLYKCCLKSVRDLHELHLRRLIGKNLLVKCFFLIYCYFELSLDQYLKSVKM